MLIFLFSNHQYLKVKTFFGQILLYTETAENYSPRALKNPHIASSLQQTAYMKNNESSVDSNGNRIGFI